MGEMETLGKFLKRERELKNISLKEITINTRIREHLLKAVEEDQYDLLPSPIYVRGFLLAYAKYIGLDPNNVLFRYEEMIKKESVAEAKPQSQKNISWNKKYIYMIGGIILICLVTSYFIFIRTSQSPMESISIKPEVEKKLPSSSVQIPKTTSIPEKKPFSIQIKAFEKTWVRIQVNGQPEKEMIFNPGEGGSYQASNRIYLLVGNAGGLDLILNEKKLEKFGKSGEVVTLIFTPEGVETKRPEKTKPP